MCQLMHIVLNTIGIKSIFLHLHWYHGILLHPSAPYMQDTLFNNAIVLKCDIFISTCNVIMLTCSNMLISGWKFYTLYYSDSSTCLTLNYFGDRNINSNIFPLFKTVWACLIDLPYLNRQPYYLVIFISQLLYINLQL